MRQSGEIMSSASAGDIILTPTQSVGGRRPQRAPNPGPPHHESNLNVEDILCLLTTIHYTIIELYSKLCFFSAQCYC